MLINSDKLQSYCVVLIRLIVSALVFGLSVGCSTSDDAIYFENRMVDAFNVHKNEIRKIELNHL